MKLERHKARPALDWEASEGRRDFPVRLNTPWLIRAITLPATLVVLWSPLAAMSGFAQGSRLEVDGFSAATGTVLSATEIPGSNYVFEASQGMRYWFELKQGGAPGGQFTYRHYAATNYPYLFYRGRLAPTEPGLAVAPQVDTNRVAVAVIGSEGGSFFLEAPDTTRFTLRVPTNALMDETVLRMTLVTNIDGVVAEPGPQAAVLLEPEGLQFHGVAELDILFPTNIPGNRMSSFKFGGDGSEFHLTADRMGSNRVTVFLPHFSGAGTAQFSEQSRATFAARSLQNTIDRLSRRIAEHLGRERQRQLAGVVDGDDAPGLDMDMINDMENILAQEMDPLVDEMAANCALARKLMPIALGFERQRQLLGVQGDSRNPETQAGVDRMQRTLDKLWSKFCPALENCKQELLERCRKEGPSTEIVRELLSIERTQQLLGSGDCAGGDILEQARECMPIWYGEIQYTEKGETNSVTQAPFGGGVTTQERKKDYKFKAYAQAATEEGFEGSLVVNVNLEALVTGQESYWEDIARSVACETGTEPRSRENTITDLKMAGSDLLKLRLDFSVQDGEAVFLMLGTESVPPAIPIRGPDIRKVLKVDCNSNQSTPIDISTETRSNYSPQGLMFFGAGLVPPTIQVTTNALSGSFTVQEMRDEVPVTMTYTFNLKRK